MKLFLQGKRYLITIFVFIPIFILLWNFTSCQKTPINGYLDGKWQVMDVTPTPDVELINERLYYNFSLHVCNLSYYGGSLTDGNLTNYGDRIILDFATATGPTTRKKLEQYGIYTNPVTFNIEYLDKNKLILSNREATVTLRKF